MEQANKSKQRGWRADELLLESQGPRETSLPIQHATRRPRGLGYLPEDVTSHSARHELP